MTGCAEICFRADAGSCAANLMLEFRKARIWPELPFRNSNSKTPPIDGDSGNDPDTRARDTAAENTAGDRNKIDREVEQPAGLKSQMPSDPDARIPGCLNIRSALWSSGPFAMTLGFLGTP